LPGSWYSDLISIEETDLWAVPQPWDPSLQKTKRSIPAGVGLDCHHGPSRIYGIGYSMLPAGILCLVLLFFVCFFQCHLFQFFQNPEIRLPDFIQIRVDSVNYSGIPGFYYHS
jgi:hypothetical protein